MRVATWNVASARTAGGGPVDLDRFAAAIAALGAQGVDVLALQEVDRAQPRSHGADLTAVAADALGAREARFVATMAGEPGTWSPVTGPGDGGWSERTPVVPEGPTYGVALLSRRPVSAWRVLRLTRGPLPLPVLLGDPPRPTLVPDEPRVAIAARVGPVTVVSTHLSFVPGWNLAQLTRVTRALVREPALAVLGDLNTGGWAARTAGGLAQAVHGPTFPAHSPAVQLDHVLVRGVDAVQGRVVDLGTSDHRALTATLRDPGTHCS